MKWIYVMELWRAWFGQIGSWNPPSNITTILTVTQPASSWNPGVLTEKYCCCRDENGNHYYSHCQLQSPATPGSSLFTNTHFCWGKGSTFFFQEWEAGLGCCHDNQAVQVVCLEWCEEPSQGRPPTHGKEMKCTYFQQELVRPAAGSPGAGRLRCFVLP